LLFAEDIISIATDQAAAVAAAAFCACCNQFRRQKIFHCNSIQEVEFF
jgi:hypothetical protein